MYVQPESPEIISLLTSAYITYAVCTVIISTVYLPINYSVYGLNKLLDHKLI